MDESTEMVDTKASGSARNNRLIASDEIEASPVRHSSGEVVGTIKKLMIDMRSGRLAYVVISFGRLLGMSEEQRALPWRMLRYNKTLEAFELDITAEQLREMPATPGWETAGDRTVESTGYLNIGAQRGDEGDEEAIPLASDAEMEVDILLERLDKKIAAEHIAMDRLLERIAIGTPR